jgi:hypothetical protein
VYFSGPSGDNVLTYLERFIDGAQSTLEITLPSDAHPALVATLQRCALRGVTVSIGFDSSFNQDSVNPTTDALRTANLLQVATPVGGGTALAFVVRDSISVWMGSAPLSKYGLEEIDGNHLVVDSVEVSQIYSQTLSELSLRTPTPRSPSTIAIGDVQLTAYFMAKHAKELEQTVVTLMSSAERIRIMLGNIVPTESIRQALSRFTGLNTDIAGIVDWRMGETGDRPWFLDNPRFASLPDTKNWVLVVDDRLVIRGTYSSSVVSGDRYEDAVVIDSPAVAATFNDYFERLYAKYRLETPTPSVAPVSERPLAWVPGELIVFGRARRPMDSGFLRDRLQPAVGAALGDIDTSMGDSELVQVDTPNAYESLVFVRFTLAATEPRAMREAVARLQTLAEKPFSDELQIDCAMPNWFAAAQACTGGGPASFPTPITPSGSQLRYTPLSSAFDLADRVPTSNPPVRVAVLDTAPSPSRLQSSLSKYPANAQLGELYDRLSSTSDLSSQPNLVGGLDDSRYYPIEPIEHFEISDHGLFVSSIVHSTAPLAGIQLVRVLNDFGIGSFHSVLVGLVRTLQYKRAEDPLIINLSLALMPALEQLASIWYGLPIDGLPGCPADPSLQFVADLPQLSPQEVTELVRRNDPLVANTIERLQAPARALIEALQANNCLVVASTGDDSMYRGIERRPRWSPRIPASYDTVLAVAADLGTPSTPARYTNRAEVAEAATTLTGSGISTLGGDLASDGRSPIGGLIGIYTAPEFPSVQPGSPPPLNEFGWAEWAGTSFATPIISGVAANLWSTQPHLNAKQVLDALNLTARSGRALGIPDRGMPSLPIAARWIEPASSA